MDERDFPVIRITSSSLRSLRIFNLRRCKTSSDDRAFANEAKSRVVRPFLEFAGLKCAGEIGCANAWLASRARARGARSGQNLATVPKPGIGIWTQMTAGSGINPKPRRTS